jgi:hypothetical protein
MAMKSKQIKNSAYPSETCLEWRWSKAVQDKTSEDNKTIAYAAFARHNQS